MRSYLINMSRNAKSFSRTKLSAVMGPMFGIVGLALFMVSFIHEHWQVIDDRLLWNQGLSIVFYVHSYSLSLDISWLRSLSSYLLSASSFVIICRFPDPWLILIYTSVRLYFLSWCRSSFDLSFLFLHSCSFILVFVGSSSREHIGCKINEDYF